MSSCCFVESLNNIVALKRSLLLTLQVNVNFVIKYRHNALKNQRGGMFKTSALFLLTVFNKAKESDIREIITILAICDFLAVRFALYLQIYMHLLPKLFSGLI